MDDENEALGAFADAGSAHAKQVAEGLRPARPGRPKGAANKKTAEFETWYRESGRRDPLIAMADFITVDPVELQAWFQEHERAVAAVGKKILTVLPSLMDIIKAQISAAGELAPYLHGKQPIRVKIEDERLPMLVLNLGTNQLDQAKTIEGRRVFSLGSALDVSMSEINDLPDGDETGESEGDDDAS